MSRIVAKAAILAVALTTSASIDAVPSAAGEV